MTIRTAIAAVSILALAGVAQAQQAPSTNNANPSAATSTGTSTSQAEMNRGVPGVNVDAGRNAPNGVMSGSVDRNTDARNLNNNNNNTYNNNNRTSGTYDSATGMRAARADRG